MTTTTEREQILSALHTWVRQRPGLEFGNYCSGYNDPEGRKAYHREVRSIGKDLRDAESLLCCVALHESITAKRLKSAFDAYSGRLSWDGTKLDYCTGQYWPTEYRRAVCAVLTSALWSWFREECNAETGDDIRKAARLELGRSIAGRWFN